MSKRTVDRLRQLLATGHQAWEELRLEQELERKWHRAQKPARKS